jgi:hypothetical protein
MSLIMLTNGDLRTTLTPKPSLPGVASGIVMNHRVLVACLLLASAGSAFGQAAPTTAPAAPPSPAQPCERSAAMVKSIASSRDSGISEDQYIAKLRAGGFDIDSNDRMRTLIHAIYGNGRTPDESAQDYLTQCKAHAAG